MAFRKPAKTKIGGKFLVYGLSTEGKSYFGCTFPKIGAIDSETGLAFYEDSDIAINGKKYNNIVFILRMIRGNSNENINNCDCFKL